MAHRMTQAFAKEHKLLSVFVTAGYPQTQDTIAICKHLQDAGADMIELGFPFSDPLADGPTIQQSNEVSLSQGMTLSLLFEQLKELRPAVEIPVLLMGYLNPVLQYGVERFVKDCQEVGIDGLILPDLPLTEYEEEYKDLFEAHDLKTVFLVTPQTSAQRIRQLDDCTTGFLYIVSTASITGNKLDVDEQRTAYFRRIQEMKLSNPLIVGFGIHDQESYEKAVTHTQGAIIGSAFIKALQHGKDDLKTTVHTFVRNIRPSHTVESDT